MKFFVILCMIASSTLVLAESESASRKIDTKEDDLREEYCDFPPHSPFTRECALFKCSKDRSRVLTIPCLYSQCPDKVNGNQGENMKPFPECCPPIVC